MKYEFLEHTADIKFRAYGATLAEAFENAVLAFSNYVSRGKKISARKKKMAKVFGTDEKNLFYNFIDELVYLVDAEGFLAVSARVKFRGNEIDVEFKGDDTNNYDFLDHVKSATYAEMEVKKIADGWVLQAVLDV